MSDNSRINTLLNNTFSLVPGNTFQDKLNYLSNCTCCHRHQINKPSIFSTWHDTPFRDYSYNQPCRCNCRHIARLICRQTEDYDPVFLVRSSTPNSIINYL